VLSFGNAQYGQLGHGYDAGKVLSDCLRPRYIDALKDEKCICIAAGELHSGVVTINGVKVIAADLAGSNGVIHVVDGVILPK
jgi:alpha-tubulin suppressor-like RCC1 family protein